MSPVLGRPPRAPRSHPVKPGAQAPGWGKGTTASGKPTRAPRATGPDEARRTTLGHEVRQRGTPPATTKAHGQVPHGQVPESAHNTQRTTAQEQVPSNTSRLPDGRVRARRVSSPYRLRNSRCPDGRVRARRVPSPCQLRTAAVRMDECAPGGYPAPAGCEQPPSGWTSERPAATPRTATHHAQPKAQHTERTHR